MVGLLSPKLKLFAEGRSKIFESLEALHLNDQKVIWMHCASLGEYEQGVPVIQALKREYPHYKILVTFFSPSGYEAKKRSTLADHIVYMPLDTPKNVNHFLTNVQPELAIFVKYEFWPNFISGLHKRKIPLLLISASFRQNQAVFKSYGKFLRDKLTLVEHFFVQDEPSRNILMSFGFDNVTMSGDTRFDRVSHQIEMDNTVEFIEEFKQKRTCIVIGSSWAEDEEIFIDFINNAPASVCFVIAPHEIKTEKIKNLQSRIQQKQVLFSEKHVFLGQEASAQVCIVDAIGYLTKLYSYADIAYVGGAMGTSGLHNILEPATFGVPILIGKNFDNFREAKQLQKLAGLFSVATKEEFGEVANHLITNKAFREKTGMIAGHFVNSNTGATAIVMDHIQRKQLLEAPRPTV
ncbi:3-deoxy-D-manno-octulosonic acid transferase [Aquimarina sp. 2-A2]|uniref:3-deoxy-D-manno-octulosonic acid transferase n=1 Tax=Aquimarina sp. 2-A2 TaxID=3382644 RepID=UPI00387EEABB